MEGALCGDDLGATGQPGDLECDLVGLGSGVAQEHSAFGAQQAHQRLGQRDAWFGGIEVRGVAQGVHLGGDGIDDGGMAVAQNIDRDAAEEVDVRLAVLVGDHGAVPADQRDGRRAVVVHHHAFPALCKRHAFTTFVPVPSSVNNSTNTQCSTRPSMTWALGTPPATARMQASIFGTMPACSVGSNWVSAATSISLTSVSRSGQPV